MKRHHSSLASMHFLARVAKCVSESWTFREKAKHKIYKIGFVLCEVSAVFVFYSLDRSRFYHQIVLVRNKLEDCSLSICKLFWWLQNNDTPTPYPLPIHGILQSSLAALTPIMGAEMKPHGHCLNCYMLESASTEAIINRQIRGLLACVPIYIFFRLANRSKLSDLELGCLNSFAMFVCLIIFGCLCISPFSFINLLLHFLLYFAK